MFPLLIRAVDDRRREDVLGVNYGVTNLGLGIGSLDRGHDPRRQLGRVRRALRGSTRRRTLLFAVLLIGLGELRRRRPRRRRRRRASRRTARWSATCGSSPRPPSTSCWSWPATASSPRAFPAWATGPADVSRSVVGFAFAANTWAIVVAQLPVLRLVRDWRRTRAVAVTGLVFGASWLVVLAAGEVVEQDARCGAGAGSQAWPCSVSERPSSRRACPGS